MTRIYFNDVVTRDGFQIEPNFIPTEDKVRLDTIYELDPTATTLTKVTIVKSKVEKANKGTVGRPNWIDVPIPLKMLVCNVSNK